MRTSFTRALFNYLISFFRSLSKLRHPNIVQFIGVSFLHGTQFPMMVMELLPESLYDCLMRHCQIPEYMKTSILYDVSLGMLYMHSQTPPIIHCNLTAINILLTSSMNAKIAGLTAAKILHPNSLKLTDDMSSWPLSSTVMPPETFSATPQCDEKFDVFSFGTLILHVCTYQRPNPAPNVTYNPQNPRVPRQLTEVERRHKYLNMVDEKNPLRAIAKSCLQGLPSQRPRTATIVSNLEEIHSSNPISPANYLEMVMDNHTLNEKQGQLTDEIAQLMQQIQTLTKEAGQKNAVATQLGKEKFSASLPIAEVSNLNVI